MLNQEQLDEMKRFLTEKNQSVEGQPPAPQQPKSAQPDYEYEAMVARNNSESQADGARSSRNNMYANIGSALEGMARAEGVARGGPGVDQGFYNGLKNDENTILERRAADRKAKVTEYLTQKNNSALSADRQTKFSADQQRQDSNDKWRQNVYEEKVKADQRDYEQRERQIAAMLAAKGDARTEAANVRADTRQNKLDDKAADVDQKNKAALVEVDGRAENIHQNLDLIDKMIEKNGTYEITGSHNQDLDRLVDQVATDMAKLQDPSSVARPSEVDAVKRNLISSGFGNSNATARDIIKNFKGEVERRKQTAYKVRGLTAPSLPSTQSDRVNGLLDSAPSTSNKPGWAK